MRPVANPNAKLLKSSLLTSAAVASISMLAAPAHATPPCTGGVANDHGGTDYTISGSHTAECILSQDDTLTITDSGSLVTSVTRSVTIDAGALLTNEGIITGNSAVNNVIYNGGDGLQIVNDGTITANAVLSSTAAIYNGGGTIDSITNTGTIVSNIAAVGIINDGGIITSILNDGGTIDTSAANSEAINNFAGSTITTINNTNGGTINGGTEAIYSEGDIGTIFNGEGSTITSGEYTIWAAAAGTVDTIENHGTITGINGSYTISNDGTSVIDLIDNYGTISSSDGSGRGIYNAATLTTLNNHTGATISAVNNGNAIENRGGTIGTITNDGTISSDNSYALDNNTNGIITTLTNNSMISAVGARAINNEADSTIGTLTNNEGATISSDNVYAIANGGTITTLNNHGTLSGGAGSTTVFITGSIGTLDNSGNISNGAIGVYVSGGTVTTLTNSGTISANSVGVEVNGTITNFTNTGTISGDDQSILAFHAFDLTNSGTIIGDIEDQSNTIDNITMTGGSITGNINFGGNNDTLVIEGGTINGNIDFGSGNENVLDIQGDFATGGTISTSVDAATNLTVENDSTFTVDHAVNLRNGSIHVHDGSTLYLSGGNVTNTNTFFNDGTTQIAVGRNLSVGSFDASTSGNMIFNASGSSGALSSGVMTLANSSGADLTNQVVSIHYTGGLLNDAASSRIVDGSNTSTLPSASLTDDSYFYDFGLERRNSNQDIYVVMTSHASVDDAATTPNNKRVANVLLTDLSDTTDPIILQIQADLLAASTQEEFNDVLEASLPTIDNGNEVVALGMTGQLFDLADSQLSDIGTVGASAGDRFKGLHFWMQGFGGVANQGMRDGTDGYDAHMGGVAIGADTRNYGKDTILGLSLGYGNATIDSRNANNTKTEVNSYQLMAYGNQDIGNSNFINGMAVYGWNTNDQTRHDVGFAGVNAAANYDSWIGGLRGGIGHNYRVEGAGSGFKLAPQLFAEYLHYDRDGYSETGAGGADITAGSASHDMLNLGATAQAEWTLKTANGSTVKPDIHASYRFDAINDSVDTTASFAAGGSTFAVDSPDPARSQLSIGAGLKLYQANGWDFSANYDYTYKSEYNAHTGFLRAAYQF